MPDKVGWSDVVANRDSARSGNNNTAMVNYRDIEKRVEEYRTESKLLRQELEKAKKQNSESAKKIEELHQTPNEILTKMQTQASPPSTAIAAFSTPATETTGERENEEVEIVAVETQQPGAKRKIPLTKTKEQNDSEKEVNRPCSSTTKNRRPRRQDKQTVGQNGKMFEMLVVRLSDSEAESKVLALKYDKRLEELENKIF
ncbi:hypothetical protein HPB51_025765 [Rhipicephalus microplus]|uniref:Uncharacterized protein n=1 Tax=Rhipicephalus microplus TaxID=6941 RepID=A0A9J6D7U2_RHIMP|nr:hypothetical protein HPB51_025765 [Rhipicephalus microplus]